ncbi:MAG: hypothetical protein ACR2MG_03070 [Pyrinomonadaceae bacterium]
MLETYKATLCGGQIKWSGEIPDAAQGETEVEIFVTILAKDSESQKPRPFGLCKGEFIVPEDFDAPLPEEILSGFEK